MDTDILIIGAGLSGLNLAHRLTSVGRDVILLEARDRVGGRALSVKHKDAVFDLGPAWYWPGQPRMARDRDAWKSGRCTMPLTPMRVAMPIG